MINIWKRYFSEPLAWNKKQTILSRNFLHLGTAGILLNVFFPGYFWLLLFSSGFAFIQIPDSLIGAPGFTYIEGSYKYKSGGKSSWPAACIESSAAKKITICAGPRVPTHGLVGQAGKPAHGFSYSSVGLVEFVVGGNTAISVSEAQAWYQVEIYKAIGLLVWTVAFYGLAFARQYKIVSAQEALPKAA